MLVLRSVCQERSFSLIFNWIFHLLITNFPILEDKKSSPKVDVYLAKKKHVSQHVNPPTCETFGRMRNAYKILRNRNNHDMYLEMYFTDVVRFLFALNVILLKKAGIFHECQVPSTPRGELSTMRAAGEYTGFVPDMQHLDSGVPGWLGYMGDEKLPRFMGIIRSLVVCI